MQLDQLINMVTNLPLGLIIGIGVGLVVVLYIIGSTINARNRRPNYDLLKTGMAGLATVLDIKYTGTEYSEIREYRIRLEVMVPGREVYHLVMKRVIGQRDLRQLQQGTSVPVKVDPHDPAQVEFDINWSE